MGYIIENDIIQNSLLRRLHHYQHNRSTTTTTTDDEDAGSVELLTSTKIDAIHNASSANGGQSSSQSATSGMFHIDISRYLYVLSRYHLPDLTGAVVLHDIDWVRVTVSGGQTVSTRLLVGADGAQSTVKRFASMSALGFNYNQHAVVATVEHAGAANTTAWQRFLPDGPVACLPCHAHYSNIVWTTTPVHAKHLISKGGVSDAQFLADLNSAFRAEPDQFQPSAMYDPSLLHY